MINKTIQRKFERWGSQRRFARFARVSYPAVNQWLHGRATSARLDALAKSWDPKADVQ